MKLSDHHSGSSERPLPFLSGLFFCRRFGMLVLSRKAGQKIHIGPDITISILEVTGKFVRIGIEAPETVNILRNEVKQQIEQENRLAASHVKHIENLKTIGSLSDLLSLKKNPDRESTRQGD
jgi:carbon storage regulator